MKKLLYIANLRLPTEKAYGIQITKMCEAFASQDIEITLVYPFRKNRIEDDIFSYYSLKRSFKTKEIWAPDFYFPGRFDKIAVSIKTIVSALLISFYVITQKADIIYSRDEWPLYFLSFFKKNLFFEAHRFSKLRKLFYKRFKNKNFKIIVITSHLKDDFIKIGFRSENMLIASDGVDFVEFDIDVSKEEARSKVGLPLDAKIIMYMGHLFEWKGAGVLLEAACSLQKKEDVLFIFVGGTDYDIEKFRKKAEGLNNVLILGHKPRKEIPVYLKSADIFVLPNSGKEEISRSYTSPMKLFEYMASGRPIIAHDLPSFREVLNEGNSFLVKTGDAKALADKITWVFENEEDAKNKVAQALKDVQEYSWQKRAEKILNFIKL